MKKVFFVLAVILFALIISGNKINIEKEEEIGCMIYYADHSMLRLVPVEYDTGKKTVQKAAESVIKKLIEGEDRNKKILRVIPKADGCMSVKLKDRTAYVNLKKEFMENKTDNKIHELLMVYSIVNSLTSVKGIDKVKFLIEGEIKKAYIGGIDMREALIPDYYI